MLRAECRSYQLRKKCGVSRHACVQRGDIGREPGTQQRQERPFEANQVRISGFASLKDVKKLCDLVRNMVYRRITVAAQLQRRSIKDPDDVIIRNAGAGIYATLQCA